jgi:hypothetical protein
MCNLSLFDIDVDFIFMDDIVVFKGGLTPILIVGKLLKDFSLGRPLALEP